MVSFGVSGLARHRRVPRWLSRPRTRRRPSGRRLSVAAALAVLAGVLVVVAPPAGAAPAACPSTAPDETAALLAARSCGGRVEVLSARTDQAQVFVDGDGTSTLEETLVPARVEHPDGTWADVDPTLVPAGGGWVPQASPVDVTVSNGGSGPFVTYRSDGSTLTLSWPLGSLPVPVVSGSAAEYPGVLPGVDLWVTVSSTGFRPVLEVENATAAANPALRAFAYTVGGTVQGVAMPDGRVRFADETDPMAAVTDSAVAWDSTMGTDGEAPNDVVASTAAEPGDLAQVAQVALTTGGTDLTMHPDPSLLTGASTVFPVFIDPSISPSESRFAYADSKNQNNDTSKARVGLDPESGAEYRSYFNFPTSQSRLTWVGKQIISAEFDIELYHSWACSDSQDDWAWAYHSAGISTSPRMPWSGGGSAWLPSGSGAAAAQGHADKDSGCGPVAQPDVLMRFSGGSGSGLKGEVQAAANQHASTFTVGLCACNPSGQLENSQQRWKKFYIDSRAKLIVKYDTPPGTPTNLSTSQVACGGGVGTASPTLRAQVPDADSGDVLTPTFQVQQLPSGTPQTVPAQQTTYPSNNFATAVANLGSGADGHSYQWRVQSRDSNGFASSWSAWCTFNVVLSAPPLPSVTATGTPGDPAHPVYAPCGTTCEPNGAPGIPGTFTLGPNGVGNVTSYTYGWTTPPTTTVTVSPGASKQITVAPPHYGYNRLYVSDSNGVKTSSISVYEFNVAAPSAALDWWRLDDVSDDGPFTNEASGNPLSTTAGVSLQPGSRYRGSEVATFNGTTGVATAADPTLDTSASFSVGAWVRPTAVGPNAMTVLGQDGSANGTDASSFYLGLRYVGSPATLHWVFLLHDTVASTSGSVNVTGPAVGAADIGTWVYLVGAYDATQKTISLYVNGVMVGTTARPAAGWRGTGPLTIGRSFFNGKPADWFTGQVEDVRVWNRAVTTDDILGAPADPDHGVAPLTGTMSPAQVGSWNFQKKVNQCGCAGPAPSGVLDHDVYLADYVSTAPTSNFKNDPVSGAASMWTDGNTGYGATRTKDGSADPVLWTNLSFTVSARVTLEPLNNQPLPTHNATIVAQDGTVNSPFYLQYNYTHAGASGWAFAMPVSDSADPAFATAMVGGAAIDTPTTLTGVYDATAGTVKLYVDGVLAATAGAAKGWQADGSLTIGRGLFDGHLTDHFPGYIDNVQVWQGAMSDQDIAARYGSGT